MKGVLLVNLGSPESPTAKDVKPYLDEFLMDKYVIDVPFLLRAFLVRGIILRKRPEKSAAAYAKIWWAEGSPLVVLSKRMFEKVKPKVGVPMALSMRYGNPNIYSGLKELADKALPKSCFFLCIRTTRCRQRSLFSKKRKKFAKNIFRTYNSLRFLLFTTNPITSKTCPIPYKNTCPDLIMTIFCSPITDFRSVIFAKQILRNHTAK